MIRRLEVERRFTVKSVEQASVEGKGVCYAYCLVQRTFVGGHRPEVESILWVFVPEKVWAEGDQVHMEAVMRVVPG